MKIKIYDTVHNFLYENEKLLLENESITQLIIHNSFVNKEKETNKELVFGRIEDENKNIKIIFANVKPYNLLIYSLDNDIVDAIKTLANYLIENQIPLRGINANKKICDEFIRCYEEKTSCKFKEYLSMDIMEITELNKEVTLPKGTFRVATVEDTNILIDWHIKFSRECLNEEVSYEEFKDKLDERIKNKSMYIFEDEEGMQVAMIAATRQLVNGVSVSLVYSNEESRGKGYGLAIVYNLSKEYLGRGNKFCSLFVDKKNPISNRVYKKIGYKILEDNYDYRII